MNFTNGSLQLIYLRLFSLYSRNYDKTNKDHKGEHFTLHMFDNKGYNETETEFRSTSNLDRFLGESDLTGAYLLILHDETFIVTFTFYHRYPIRICLWIVNDFLSNSLMIFMKFSFTEISDFHWTRFLAWNIATSPTGKVFHLSLSCQDWKICLLSPFVPPSTALHSPVRYDHYVPPTVSEGLILSVAFTQLTSWFDIPLV